MQITDPTTGQPDTDASPEIGILRATGVQGARGIIPMDQWAASQNSEAGAARMHGFLLWPQRRRARRLPAQLTACRPHRWPQRWYNEAACAA